MEIHDHFFKTKIEKNCRQFFKRIYDLPIPVSEEFVRNLIDYGELTIHQFAHILPGAKDTFQIRHSDGTEISGIIGDKSILFVIPQNKKSEYEKFENTLINYVSNHHSP